MTKFENMKFFINNDKELSKKVQERLFELGNSWQGGRESTSFDCSEMIYLYTKCNGKMTYASRFDTRQDYPLKTLEDIMSEPNEYKYTFLDAMELAEKEGKKFVGNKNTGNYRYWFYCNDDKKHTLDRDDDFDIDLEFDFHFVSQMFKEYKPEPKMVAWYAPKYVYRKGASGPQMYIGIFYKSKDEYTELHDTKVLEWEEKQFPETYEECE